MKSKHKITRRGFVFPTTVFLMGLTLTILLIQLMAYQSAVRTQRADRKYWQIQTLVNRVNEMQLKQSPQTIYQFPEGKATLRNSQMNIVLSSGETAVYHVWERKHNLK
ncbi:MAG TPA: hypothetical protein DCW31_03340 [Lactobacillus sp.]|nr:hypothetical protein [Lactobacillus sp.]